jgi:hypothetical protein
MRHPANAGSKLCVQLPPNCAPDVYASETVVDPAYPFNLLCRLITVSLESMRIVRSLPALDILDPSR